MIIAGDEVESWGDNPPGSGADSDGDGILDGFDNCPEMSNGSQEDVDLDRVGDVCDPFPTDPDNELAQCEEDLAIALPEPSGMMMLTSGLVALLLLRSLPRTRVRLAGRS